MILLDEPYTISDLCFTNEAIYIYIRIYILCVYKEKAKNVEMKKKIENIKRNASTVL